MNSTIRWTQVLSALTVGVVCLIFAVSMSAQVQTRTSTTTHTPRVETTVERGEVVFVNGNDLIVKMEDGSLRHITNVPESTRITVDGKQIGIHDVRVGMKLERTITTTSIPKTITTTKTVTGKIFQIMPPTTVILTLEDNTTQQFNIPRGQKFNVDGQMVDAWGLRKGMRIAATKIVEEPVTEIEEQKRLTGSMPPPPAPPPAQEPILVAVARAPAAPVPAALPKTGSPVPFIGLLGLLSLAGSFGLRAFRS